MIDDEGDTIMNTDFVFDVYDAAVGDIEIVHLLRPADRRSVWQTPSR